MARNRPRLTRRRLLLGGASAAALSAMAGGVAWQRRGDSNGRPLPASTPGPSPAPSATATPLPRGGVARLVATARFNFDTFDSLKTGEPSVVDVLGRTHSRLVQWADFAAARLDGDLASASERPDRLTWILHLDPAARWQDSPPVNGRPVTADDIVQHLSRTLAIANSGPQPGVQRATDYLSIRRVTAPAADRVVIETSRPDPFLAGTLAGRVALVQAPEAVAAFEKSWHEHRPDQVMGSGPFQLVAHDRDGTLRFRAHVRGHRQPLLDGLAVSEPFDEVERFVRKEVDEILTRDRRDAARIRAAAPGASERPRFEESPVISTFFVGAPPWDNPELRRALSGALNRHELSRRLFGGRAEPSARVAPVWPEFAPSETDLARYPGYRTSFEDDAREARARWQAAGAPAFGPVTVDFPAIFDPLYSASSVVVGMLNEILGAQFRAAVDSYQAISRKAIEHRYGNGNAAFWFGWGPLFVGADPSRFLDETYHSSGPGFATTGFRSAEVDRALDAISGEFDLPVRKEMVKRLALALLDAGGGGVIDWLVQRAEVFRQPYYQATPPSPFWNQHLDVAAYLDSADPSFESRPGI